MTARANNKRLGLRQCPSRKLGTSGDVKQTTLQSMMEKNRIWRMQYEQKYNCRNGLGIHLVRRLAHLAQALPICCGAPLRDLLEAFEGGRLLTE
jgi:hypothetical protein